MQLVDHFQKRGQMLPADVLNRGLAPRTFAEHMLVERVRAPFTGIDVIFVATKGDPINYEESIEVAIVLLVRRTPRASNLPQDRQLAPVIGVVLGDGQDRAQRRVVRALEGRLQ